MIVHNLGFGQPSPQTTTRQARTAILHFGEEQVLVQNVSLQADQSFVGEITGFEPSIEVTHDGLTVGDTIGFRDSHIFAYDI